MDRATAFDIITSKEPTRLKHWQTGLVKWEDLVAWVADPLISPKRETTGYVVGKFKPTEACEACADAGLSVCLQRNKYAVVNRGALLLDADNPVPTFLVDLAMELDGVAYAVHTTHSSRPDAPRYRIIVPLVRPVTPEEYGWLVRDLMERVGLESFDQSCDQASRFMYRPITAKPEWYSYVVNEGESLAVEIPAEELSKITPKVSRNKRDPFELEGIKGEFNRAYQDDFDGLIEQYDLPYVAVGDRWKLATAAAKTKPAVEEIKPGLYWSDHETDPAAHHANSAFDMVRDHRFLQLDVGVKPNTPPHNRPSDKAMCELAAMDPRVMNATFDALPEEEKWKADLKRSTKSRDVLPTVRNLDLIFSHDSLFLNLRYHVLRMVVETVKDLPWRGLEEQGGPVFTDVDESQARWYLEREYGLKLPSQEVRERVLAAARRSWYNPVLDYLEGLVWDGTSRIETCLPGVRPSPYTRLVARKSLVAAVARMLNPGVKWDHTLVLVGKQGIGKTYWVQKMSKGWTAPLGRLDDKDTLMTLQRSWIVTSDEAHTLRKAESEAQKEFLTRTADVFRAPYDRTMQEYKRHCVIWGTTNDQVFLRDQEGNRRFLVVRCESRLDFEAMTDDYVDQLWAEAVQLYREQGERLYLTDEESALATEEVAQHVEEDSLYGIVQEYLDKSISDFEDEDGGEVPRRNMVCTRELWDHALGNMNPPKRSDLIELGTVLLKIPGWYRLPGLKKVPNYGPQRVFVRIGSSEDPAADLL